jgi:hypothetical protein
MQYFERSTEAREIYPKSKAAAKRPHVFFTKFFMAFGANTGNPEGQFNVARRKGKAAAGP